MIILDYKVGEKNAVDYIALDGEMVRYKTGRAEKIINKMAASLEITPQELVKEIEEGWSNGYISFVPVEINKKQEQTVAAASLQDWVERKRMTDGR